jgi:MFS family permease
VTGVVGIGVALQGSALLSPDELEANPDAVVGTNVSLYLLIVVATLLLGIGEVLYDNTAQTFMPRVVSPDQLEKANGRLWSAEQIANSFAGPPLAALLLTVAFAAPFGADALTFAVSAALIGWIALDRADGASQQVETEPHGDGEPHADGTDAQSSWWAEAKEGFAWLWNHDFFRSLAIVLGLFNLLGVLSQASLILFAQEILNTSATEFAILSMGGAIGGVIGGWSASWISEKIGPGPSLWVALFTGGFTSLIVAFTTLWPVVLVCFALFMVTAVLWNVITVSLRQAVIPDHLLGRVNSVYRFFAWGMMPIGALLGGVIMVAVEATVNREWALRAPWIVAGLAHFVLLAWAGPKLTTARIEAVRATAPARPVDAG